jgi:hypothetical protein
MTVGSFADSFSFFFGFFKSHYKYVNFPNRSQKQKQGTVNSNFVQIYQNNNLY